MKRNPRHWLYLFAYSAGTWALLVVAWLSLANLWHQNAPMGESYIPLFLLAPPALLLACITPVLWDRRLLGFNTEYLGIRVRQAAYAGGALLCLAFSSSLGWAAFLPLLILTVLGMVATQSRLGRSSALKDRERNASLFK